MERGAAKRMEAVKATLKQSRALIECATLRLAETDRLLAKYGLKRSAIKVMDDSEKEGMKGVKAEPMMGNWRALRRLAKMVRL